MTLAIEFAGRCVHEHSITGSHNMLGLGAEGISLRPLLL